VVKPPLRTKTLGTKVSEEEFAQLEAVASERGLTLSEWCRETLLASVNGQEPQAAEAGGTGQAALMAELVALRAILLNLLFKLANGEKPTAEEMQRLIDRADSDKLKNRYRHRAFERRRCSLAPVRQDASIAKLPCQRRRFYLRVPLRHSCCFSLSFRGV
jgi:hypothetical protein